jgi:hypothetical protein
MSSPDLTYKGNWMAESLTPREGRGRYKLDSGKISHLSSGEGIFSFFANYLSTSERIYGLLDKFLTYAFLGGNFFVLG